MARKGKLLYKLAAAAFWLLLWQVLSVIIDKEVLLPSPYAVLLRLVELAQTAEFWRSSLYSLLRVAAGFALACVAGCILSVLMHISALARELFSPMLRIVKATPVASFIILALVWVKSAALPSFIAFLMVLPIVTGNLSEGLSQVEPGLLDMARVFRLSRLKRMTRIYIPSAAPYFFAACKTGIGLAWKAGIAAEVIAVSAQSIGGMLHDSKSYLETTDLFAWTAVVIVLSGILEYILVRVTDRLCLSCGKRGAADVDKA